MSYRLLKSYEFAHEAYLDLTKLQDEQIHAFLKNDTMVSIAPHYSNAVGGVLLFVPEEQWDLANQHLFGNKDSQHLLEDLFPGSSSEDMRTCPKCSSSDVFQGRSLVSGILIWIISALPISIRKNRFHCASCGHSWSLKT